MRKPQENQPKIPCQPFMYQMTEWDCVPTTLLNALRYLFPREVIPPEALITINQLGMDEKTCWWDEEKLINSSTKAKAATKSSESRPRFLKTGRGQPFSGYSPPAKPRRNSPGSNCQCQLTSRELPVSFGKVSQVSACPLPRPPGMPQPSVSTLLPLGILHDPGPCGRGRGWVPCCGLPPLSPATTILT